MINFVLVVQADSVASTPPGAPPAGPEVRLHSDPGLLLGGAGLRVSPTWPSRTQKAEGFSFPTLLRLFCEILTAKRENVITVKAGPRGAGEGSGAASQEAIKMCDHLFPLPHLIHLSGEWFCPYPPKATNLFCCLSPCIRMNL